MQSHLTILFTLTRAIHLSASLLMLGVWMFDQIMRDALSEFQDFWRTISRRILWPALILAALSGIAWFILVVINMADASFSDALRPSIFRLVLSQTQFGELWKWRAAFWLISLLAFAWHRAKPLALFPSILFVATLAWSGHGQTGSARSWHLFADIIHLLICSIWPAGLLPFILLLAKLRHISAIESLGRLTRRFSAVSLLSVALLLATGIINACCLLSSFNALFSSAYGRILLLKIALFAIMVSLGAVNLLHLKPRVSSDPDCARQLQRNASIELAIGTIVLLIVGLLGTLAPANG